MRIKKGDKVLIIKGKDRGKSNKVIRVMPRLSTIVVESLNLRKKTIRPKKQGERGQVVDVPWPVHIENVMMICSACNKPTRLGYRNEEKTKVRYCKKCKATI
jgi:large subunit ribosomal protein L24